ncbi:family 2 glycosyl transferase [Paenibacillus solisilvae]|uniref:Family 2 glycosyl transferase n=1 Tax=Paenibacillus solisilvae TaxID=2486751 RepID=A0ABW0VQM7_9BACL
MRRSRATRSKLKRRNAGRSSRSAALLRRDKRGLFSSASDLRAAYSSGMQDAKQLRASGFPAVISNSLKQRINESWTRRCEQRPSSSLTGKRIADSSHYAEGFMAELNLPSQAWLPVPKHQSAAAVVLPSSGLNIAAIQELLRLPLDEIIVVLEAQGEKGFAEARRLPGVTIVHITESLGQDVGRAVGAKLTKAETVLFTDGSVFIPAERLAFLLAAADSSTDVALSDISGAVGLFSQWDDITRIRAFMNWSLGRPDLAANSAADLPQAWSRRAIQLVGAELLAVPPVAHQFVIQHKLTVTAYLIQKGTHSLIRRTIAPFSDTAAERLIIGDHIEALAAAMEHRGSRLSYLDRSRTRIAGRGGGS